MDAFTKMIYQFLTSVSLLFLLIKNFQYICHVLKNNTASEITYMEAILQGRCGGLNNNALPLCSYVWMGNLVLSW